MRPLATLLLIVFAMPLSAQWIGQPTPGIPRKAGGDADLAAAAPRTADGRTDLSGLWRPAGVTGDLRDVSRLKPWVREAMAAHERNYYKQGPHMACLPSGPGYIAGSGGGGGGMRRIVQGSNVIAVLHSDMIQRQIFLDGRQLETDPLPVWMGYSVGRWDGATLVVESNGYNDKTWLHPEGLVHTEQLRVTERYTRRDFGHLQIDVTYTDAGAFDSPLHAVVELVYAADDELLELVCNEAEEGSSKHWVGDKLTDAAQAAVEVPASSLAAYVGRYEGIWLSNPTTVERFDRGWAPLREPQWQQPLRARRAVRDNLCLPDLPVGTTLCLHTRCRWQGDPGRRGAGPRGAWIFKRTR